jgi:hypothetical protein
MTGYPTGDCVEVTCGAVVLITSWFLVVEDTSPLVAKALFLVVDSILFVTDVVCCAELDGTLVDNAVLENTVCTHAVAPVWLKVVDPGAHWVQPVDPGAGENVLFWQGVHTVLMVLSRTGLVPAGHGVHAVEFISA